MYVKDLIYIKPGDAVLRVKTEVIGFRGTNLALPVYVSGQVKINNVKTNDLKLKVQAIEVVFSPTHKAWVEPEALTKPGTEDLFELRRI